MRISFFITLLLLLLLLTISTVAAIHGVFNVQYKFSDDQQLSLSVLKAHDFRRQISLLTGTGRPDSVGLYHAKIGIGTPSRSNLGDSGSEWPILRRWEVPWEWQTVSLTSLACGLGFVLTGLVVATALPYLGIRPGMLSLDEKAELLFINQGITTAAVLGIIYSVFNTYQPLPEGFFKYDLREPFNLQNGWLLWAGVGHVGALVAIGLTGVAVSFFNGETPKRETDALVRLLPLIGSSSISTACLVGITCVFAPLLEETVFRGFYMTSLTKWVPTPVAIILSAAVFALAHLTPGEFPQLFVLGSALGISYAQTRNLLTPITIHAFWNSGVILLLTVLQDSGSEWPILRRWEVPWEWQTVSLTSLACGLGFVLTGLVVATALPYLGIRPGMLSLDEKAELLFINQGTS